MSDVGKIYEFKVNTPIWPDAKQPKNFSRSFGPLRDAKERFVFLSPKIIPKDVHSNMNDEEIDIKVERENRYIKEFQEYQKSLNNLIEKGIEKDFSRYFNGYLFNKYVRHLEEISKRSNSIEFIPPHRNVKYDGIQYISFIADRFKEKNPQGYRECIYLESYEEGVRNKLYPFLHEHINSFETRSTLDILNQDIQILQNTLLNLDLTYVGLKGNGSIQEKIWIGIRFFILILIGIMEKSKERLQK